MSEVMVELGRRTYPIYIGSGLLRDGELLARHLAGSEALVVTDEAVSPLYLDTVTDALQDRVALDKLVLPTGEAHKNFQTLGLIYDRLMESGHQRSTTLLALGGGVIGDLTGFAAATYQRGVRFLQLPTTLLAQVDSSVGGKTAVNHPLGKNMIGAFHQPGCVLVDLQTLVSLPERHYRAGLAEIGKYGLGLDGAFFAWLEDQLPALLARDEAVLEQVIERSCRIKAEVVARDETDSGGGVRELLNLGHSFGHALELLASYGQWLHGEAVAVGLVLAATLSERVGWLESRDRERCCHWLERVGLPVKLPHEHSPEQMVAAMARDKKNRDRKFHLVLLKEIGKAEATTQVSKKELLGFLAQAMKAG